MQIKFDGVSNVLFAIACLVVIAVGGLQLRDRLKGSVSLPTSKASAPAPLFGPAEDININVSNATVKSRGTPAISIIEFSDFQCPFCGEYARNTYALIERDFVDSGLVAYAFFNFPMERTHPLALHAAESAECAGRQQKFWQMHDVLFRDQRALMLSDLVDHARRLELRVPDFQECMAGTMLPKIRGQVDVGRRSGVNSTPTFFIGRLDSGTVHAATRLLGTQSYKAFAAALKAALAQKPK